MNNRPVFIEERIGKLGEETKVNTDTLREEYEEIVSDPFIQNDPQFTTNSQRYIFALKVLISRTRPGKLSTEDPEEAEV